MHELARAWLMICNITFLSSKIHLRTPNTTPMRKEKPMDKVFETLPEFMARNSISRSAVYREYQEGRLVFTKRGRRTLIHREDSEKWVEALRSSKPKAK